ncbi:MAG TPA: metalloregulator ArsR/SmtB family transcription factor [Caldilineaceae bacterium]|nr:metalloregulator ArsR/SmtB family transcription factor [Caldilineaceae bacterium]
MVNADTAKPKTSLPELTLHSRLVGCCGMLPALRWTEEEAERLAAMLKALAHPVRLQIVELLSRYAGQVCVCDVETQFDLSQPTISHHLKVLRQAGLIDCEQRGVWVYYYTRPETLAQLATVLGTMAESGES